MSNDKPVIKYKAYDIDFVGVASGPSPFVAVILDCEGDHHISLELTIEAVSKLEAKLQSLSEELASQHPLQ